MIQRIQTVYLGLAAICVVVGIFLPIAVYTSGDVSLELGTFGLTENDLGAKSSFPHFGSYLVVAVMCILSIMQYKNRKKQLKLGRVLYLLVLLSITLLFLDYSWISETLGEEFQVATSVGLFAPVAALPFIFLASRSIKKDEALVKSLDRLR